MSRGALVCRNDAIDLPPLPESARLARRFLADACRRWALNELRDDLLLAVSELVTNSIIHARTPVAVNVRVTTGMVEVGVRDHDPRPPVVRAQRPDLISDLDTLSERLPSFQDDDPRHPHLWVGDAGSVAAGRGLHLLSGVSDDWGVATHDGPDPGKEVWFTHAVPPSWPYRQECPCVTGAPLTTASGRPLQPVPGPWDRAVSIVGDEG
jgi:hypothetical protein